LRPQGMHLAQSAQRRRMSVCGVPSLRTYVPKCGCRFWRGTDEDKLYKLQFWKIPLISLRVERHETISVRQGMRSNDEIGQQTLRHLMRRLSSRFRITCKTPTNLNPYGLLKLNVHSDARIGKKIIYE